MLSSEQAQDRLKAFKKSHYQQEQLKRIAGLGESLAYTGQILIQAGPAWDKVAKNREQKEAVRSEAHSQLGQLKSKDRQELFKTLFPQIFPQVEAAWNQFDILPYQTTYYRRPFRNPNHDTPGARIRWLENLLLATRGYDQDVTWFAAWAPHLGYTSLLGYLFAGAIETGGEIGQQVFDILIASGNGSHEIGRMGRHVVRGLLCASRPDGWEFIERMLIAAQREEGLRQVILESIDEAHPQAFRRLLQLIIDRNLSRFSAAIRAFDVWFGLALEAVSQKTVAEILAHIQRHLNDPAEQTKAIQEGSAQEAYYALWAMAFDNVIAALPYAVELRQSPHSEHRFAATHLLAQTNLTAAFEELLNAVEDPDLRIAARAALSLKSPEYDQHLLTQSDLFERLEHLITRLPHKENVLKPLVWDWLVLKLDRATLIDKMIECLGSRSPKRLAPYLSSMEPMARSKVARLLKESGDKGAETREVLFRLVGDPSYHVRQQSLGALRGFHLTEAEMAQMENLLTRQAEDLRRGIVQLLLELPNEALLLCIGRLLGKKNEKQRRAGLELLRESVRSNRCKEECIRLASEYKEKFSLLAAEETILEDILAEEIELFRLDDALGLMNPKQRTQPKPPRSKASLFDIFKKVKLGSSAALEILKSLDQLIEAHRADPVELILPGTKKTALLGNVRSMFPKPDPAQSLEQDLTRLPLKDMWETWWETRPAALCDPDGFELLRALAITYLFHPRLSGSSWITDIPEELQGFFEVQCDFRLNYEPIISAVLKWLIRSYRTPNEAPFLLDALETSVSRTPISVLAGVEHSSITRIIRTITFSHNTQRLAYLNICRWHRAIYPESWQNEHHARLWEIVRWLDEPEPGIPRYFPLLEDALFGLQADAATQADLLDLLLGARNTDGYGNPFSILRQLSGRKPHPYFEKYPLLKELVNICRERIISIEIRRGDLPTAATVPASALRSVPGMRNLFLLLDALGKTGFERKTGFGHDRKSVLSALIRLSYPVEEDTYDGFKDRANLSELSEKRLVELAVYAPQWAGFVEYTLNWPKLRDAVFWMHAHTKDRQWSVDKEIRELWMAQVSEYTPLSADSLMDGAVDVTWFQKIYAALGTEHWQKVYQAAELTAAGRGHMRARIFADAMLGKLSSQELAERITQKRHQDSLRALGLIPIPEGENRQQETLLRYEVMKEFLRTGKKFGSQRQASEKLAVAIGMENLARNAGFTDPQRLEWAMEVEAVADLLNGPLVVETGGINVSLFIDELGEPQLTATKNSRPLKTIPAHAKKDARIASLLERKRNLDRQTNRMRQSLEQAMCRGDMFTGTELNHLFRHPMLRAMLEQLIFAGPAGMGYPVEAGRALFVHSGRQIPINREHTLRIAHPVDLLESGEWHLWQRECFIAERIQPFKQVFRELYVLTSSEKIEGNLSRRYAGQQINPHQALALFATCGWVVDPGEGVHKTFHSLGISARVGFLQGAFTPAEVEGLTLESVVFTQRGEWALIQLDQIHPRIFSEVMRDVDLVVSVAHAGGIDPETSASSLEARTTLIVETCNLLNIQNVQVKNHHAVVSGKLGNYTIHLGSAVVHKQPGGSLCIVPIHSQHRGRLFLPFVDNDPKTAEIISKVILLAKDNEIKDPTILEQILR